MNRELIYDALFSLLIGTNPFKYTSRRMKLWTDISPADKPALVMMEGENEYTQQRGMPAKIVLNVDVYVYICTAADPGTIPASTMNQILDNIDTALRPDDQNFQVQTLGGLVSHCWIEGPIIIDTGDIDPNGDGIAVIPIKILTNH